MSPIHLKQIQDQEDASLAEPVKEELDHIDDSLTEEGATADPLLAPLPKAVKKPLAKKKHSLAKRQF